MSNGDTAAQPAEPKALENIQNRLEGNNEHLAQAAERLEHLSDRIQGSIPRDTEKINKLTAAEVPAGELQGIHSRIDRMSGISDRIYSVLNRLEELA